MGRWMDNGSENLVARRLIHSRRIISNQEEGVEDNKLSGGPVLAA